MLIRNRFVWSALLALGALSACEVDDTGGDDTPIAGKSGSGGASSGGSQSGSGGQVGGKSGAGGTSPSAGTRNYSGAAGAPLGGEGGSGGDDDGASGEAGASGHAGAGGEGSEPGLPTHLYGYVSTIQGDLVMYSIDPTSGEPTELPDSPRELDGFLHGLAVHESQDFLFVVAQPSRIDTFPIAADGSVPEEPTASLEVDDEEPLLALALEPSGRFAYASSPFSSSIHSFTIDVTTGAFATLGEPLLVGPGPGDRRPAHIAADPSGHYVYVTQLADPTADEDDNGIRGYRINQQTGALTELPASPFGNGDMIGGGIAFRPDGKFLYSSGGGLYGFAIDEESGNLTMVEGSPFTEDIGSDPWALPIAITPQGDYLYATQFLATQHLSGFAIDADSGALEEVPGSPLTTFAPYSIALEPTGRFLFVGDDSGRVPVYSVSRENGSLELVEGSPFGFGGLEPDFAFSTRP